MPPEGYLSQRIPDLVADIANIDFVDSQTGAQLPALFSALCEASPFARAHDMHCQ